MGIEFLSEDPLLSKTVNDLLANESLNAYDRNGALMFSGTPGKLATVPDHSDIGSITNREGMTIVRFWPETGRGFLARSYIPLILRELRNHFAGLRSDEKSAKEVRGTVAMLTDGLADPAFGEIRAIYAKLLREHRHRLSDRAFEVGVARADPDSDELRILYEGVDPYLGMRFRAHGISKSHPLENLLNLLKHGIDPSRTFHSAPFALPSEYAELMAGLETATGTAYRDGIALLVGWPDKPIETGFAVVFLNDAYHPLLEPLRKAFPNTRIEPLSREKPVLEELSRKAMGK